MGKKIDPLRPATWQPPEGWRRIATIDAHAAGEPFRVVLSGVPQPPGATLLERRRWARQHLDELRTGLLWEPRGHGDMYGCLLTPAVSPQADFGVLFLHNEGYSTMCGHGIIALSTVVFETGMLPASEPESELKIDTPAGLVTSWSRIEAGRVRAVRFHNVASYVVALDQKEEVPGLGTVSYDLAFGGAYYAFVEASEVGLSCSTRDLAALIETAGALKRRLARRPIDHPLDSDLGFLYGVVFVGPAETTGARGRHVCIFADGEVDRSPTGTAVSARLAIHHARGELEVGERITIESILGSHFGGMIVETTNCGGQPAIVPEVRGTAYVTGRHEFLYAPDDPLHRGFLLR